MRGLSLSVPHVAKVLLLLLAASAVWLGAGLSWAPPAAGADPEVLLTRGPYLQDVTANSALVCWEARSPHSGAVSYGTTPEFRRIAPTEREGNGHCVRLRGLQPYTRYHYRVMAGGAALSPPYAFRTLAEPSQGETQFVAWGDNRTNHAIHRLLAALVKQATPDFVINTGDLVERGDQMGDWDTFFDIEREVLANAPMYPSLGNHERNSPLYFSLFHLPGNERWYSFDSGPAHFAVLDVFFSPYEPGSEQYAWLEQDLQETKQPWKIVMLHYPLHAVSPPSRIIGRLRDALPPLLEKYGVQLVLSGHNHNYQRNVVNGVTYLVTGGGGAPLHTVTRGPNTRYSEATYHFVKIAIKGRRLASTGVRVDGTEFDSFSLVLPQPVGSQELPLEIIDAPIAAAATRPPARLAPLEFVETWSWSRCHQPFRLDNIQLLRYGWRFHRTHILVLCGGLGAIIVGVVMWHRFHRKSEKGGQSDAQSQADH